MVFKGAKEQKQKRKASAKQLEHLAKAREKANATRKANKIKREEAKLNKLRGSPMATQNVINNDNPSNNINDLKITNTKVAEIKKEFPAFQQFTKDDIMKLQEDAITNYEVKRKARKAKKKDEQAKDVVQKKDFDAVTRAMKPAPSNPDDVWNICFN